MKLSQILEKGQDAILIEEWCDRRFVGPHTSHGFGDDEDSNYYFLYFDGYNGGSFTSVSIDQEVKTENNSVFCVDTKGNNIELRFFLGIPISF